MVRHSPPYKCKDCEKIRPLVIFRGSASLCDECYSADRTKRKVLRELNQMFSLSKKLEGV